MRPAAEHPAICPQDRSPTFEPEGGIGLNRGIEEQRTLP
jgi:hypothetical protein